MVVSAPVREVLFFSFVIAVKGILAPLLEIVDIAADDRFGDLVHVLDLHLLSAPTLEQAKRLFVRVHRFLPELTAAAVHHKLIQLPVKCHVFHRKTPPVYRFFVPNKLRVFIASAKKVYSLFSRKSLNFLNIHSPASEKYEREKPCDPRLFSPSRLLLAKGQRVRDHGDELAIRGLSLDIRHRVAEVLLQHLDVAPIPGHLDGMANFQG